MSDLNFVQGGFIDIFYLEALDSLPNIHKDFTI
jgi:hypothetical protein